jgi:hypothetical protein
LKWFDFDVDHRAYGERKLKDEQVKDAINKKLIESGEKEKHVSSYNR